VQGFSRNASPSHKVCLLRNSWSEYPVR
jgi:hypothetical protein